MEYNLKALKLCEENLILSLDREDNFEIYLNLANLLHWIIMTEEWHKKHNPNYNLSKIEKNVSELMNAIRFANNSMKHNMIFKKLHQNPTAVRCGSSRAVCGTFYTAAGEVIWLDISKDFKNKPKWQKEQYIDYSNHLKFKPIRSSLKPALVFIEKESNKLLQN